MADAFLRRELLRDAAFAKFAPVAIHDVSEKRLLRHEEVAGIDVAISLDYDMSVAASSEEALFRAPERRVRKRRVDIANRNAPYVSVLEPSVENAT